MKVGICSLCSGGRECNPCILQRLSEALVDSLCKASWAQIPSFLLAKHGQKCSLLPAGGDGTEGLFSGSGPVFLTSSPCLRMELLL